MTALTIGALILLGVPAALGIYAYKRNPEKTEDAVQRENRNDFQPFIPIGGHDQMLYEKYIFNRGNDSSIENPPKVVIRKNF